MKLNEAPIRKARNPIHAIRPLSVWISRRLPLHPGPIPAQRMHVYHFSAMAIAMRDRIMAGASGHPTSHER